MGAKTAAPQLSAKSVAPSSANVSSKQTGSHPHAVGLQQGIGNAATMRLFRSPLIQPKLTVSHPEDESEREADRVADQVMRMTEPPRPQDDEEKEGLVHRKFGLTVQRKCNDCSSGGEACSTCAEEENLQRAIASGPVAPIVQAKHDSSQSEIARTVPVNFSAALGGGRPLPAVTRSFFEPRFGADFSGVRIHTDGEAAQAARSVSARAFTLGRDLVFGTGQYSPETTSGKQLLAHELTHVLQQGGGTRATTQEGPTASLQRSPAFKIMRKGFDSTFEICHRVLETRDFEVTNGGVRVVMNLFGLDKDIQGCDDFEFGVTLTKSVDWWPDNEIATCKAKTGGVRTFSFANLSSGTYYLTIWRVFDHRYCCLEGEISVYDEAVSSSSAGCKLDEDPSVSDIVHGALDIAGFIPVLGAIPDGINAVIYAAEGDWVNAGISAVAMIPVFGDGAKVVTKLGKEVVEVSGKTVLQMGEKKIASELEKVALREAEKKAAQKLEKEAAQKLEKGGAEKAGKESHPKKAEEPPSKEGKKKKKGPKCTPAEIVALNTAMHVFCDKPRSCSMQADNCQSATAKVAAGYGCVDARVVLQQKCFSPGDPGYENHMKQIAQASAALRNCLAVMAAKCK